MILRVVAAAASLLFCFLVNNNIGITAALSFGQRHDEQGQQFPLGTGDHHHQLALNPSDQIREA